MNQHYQKELEELETKGMLRSLPQMELKGGTLELNGKRMQVLSSNDYLGLAKDAVLAEQEAKLLSCYGLSGSLSSRLLAGNHAIYDELEETMAKAFGREAVLTFVSGYHMNVGIIGALARKGTLILADKLVHASMIDGIRLASAPFERFKHNDLGHLERLILKHQEQYEELIVMVESVYSMDGDTADLKALVRLKQRYPKLRLYVDEAHAIGVRGAKGLGLAEETETIQDIDFLLGTFGKALASLGGYIVCDKVVRSYLINKCRSLIFSTAMPPIRAGFNKAVFDLLASFGERRKRLAEGTKEIKDLLSELGLNTKSESQILPIIIGEAKETERYAELMQAEGFYVQAIRPPTVPEGSCRLRLSLTASTDFDKLKASLKRVFSF